MSIIKSQYRGKGIKNYFLLCQNQEKFHIFQAYCIFRGNVILYKYHRPKIFKKEWILMIRSLKEIRKALRASKKEHKYDEQGRVIIDLRVRDDSEFLSPYSTENHSIISEDVAEFIEYSMQGVPPEKSVHFRIHSDVITPEEQTEYTDAIRSRYADKYRDSCFEKKHLHKTAAVMTLIAVAALALMIQFEYSALNTAVISEIIDIFAWVFMWEAVDIAFLQCTMLRFKQQRYLHLADSTIEYVPVNSGKKQK